MSGGRDGFTLIETLVALAVFALAALALIHLTGESLRSAARAEVRTLGGVVADNLAAEAVIDPALPLGRATGRRSLSGRDWRWERDIAPTSEAAMQQVTVVVSDADGRAADRTAWRPTPATS